MAPRIKKNYPKMKFIITGDALYATKPIIDLCESKDYKWKYIFNLKKDRLKTLYNNFEDDLKYENETNKENYFLSSKLEYKNHKLSAVRYLEMQDNKLVTFNYITNLQVTNNNVEEIVKLEEQDGKLKMKDLESKKMVHLKLVIYVVEMKMLLRYIIILYKLLI